MSNDEKRYTERDLVMARREGYADAMGAGGGWDSVAKKITRERYPLPKVSRPRVLGPDEVGRYWKIVDGRWWYQHRAGGLGSPWLNGGVVQPECERIRFDLVCRPTEEVEDG